MKMENCGNWWEMVGNGWKGWEINEKSLKERFSCNWKDINMLL